MRSARGSEYELYVRYPILLCLKCRQILGGKLFRARLECRMEETQYACAPGRHHIASVFLGSSFGILEACKGFPVSRTTSNRHVLVPLGVVPLWEQVVMCSICGSAGVIQSSDAHANRPMFLCSCGNPVIPATPAQLLAALSRGAGMSQQPRGAPRQVRIAKKNVRGVISSHDAM